MMKSYQVFWERTHAASCIHVKKTTKSMKILEKCWEAKLNFVNLLSGFRGTQEWNLDENTGKEEIPTANRIEMNDSTKNK